MSITLLKTDITLLSTDAIVNAANEELRVAMEHGLHSIAFPLISAGIYGYPVEGAWRKALEACRDFLKEQPEYEMEMVFAIISDEILEIGNEVARCVI